MILYISEKDDISEDAGEESKDVPAQLLFLHEGQQADVKEITWHSSAKNLLVSTASDGLHMFIPNNL